VSHRLPQSEIDAALAAAGLVALEPYASRNAPLKCRCLRCDSIVSPRLGNIKSAGQGGCKVCAGRQSSVSRATPPEERARLLAAVGLVEVGGYRNALTRVTCRCLRCGRTVRVRLSDIRGGSGCSHCSPSGFDSTSPARVYLLRHDALDAIKVGVCGVGTSRIAQHQRRGWTVVRSHTFATGRDALDAEQAVLRWWRRELLIPPAMQAEDMPGGGWTETATATGGVLEATLVRIVGLCGDADDHHTAAADTGTLVRPAAA
jgi:hypothetical protein